MQSYIFPLSKLRGFCIRVLTNAVDVPKREAEIVTDVLLEADLLGHHSHGIVRIPFYVKDIQAGLMEPATRVTIEKDSTGWALLDAGRGWGHVAATRAIELAIEKAKSSGVAMVGVRRSSHFGMARYYANIAVKSDMVGIVYSTAEPTMAPWGGLTPLIGATPMAIGMPTNSGFPLILDMAPTVTALGNVSMAAFRGEKIPEGWVTDREGRPTTDPSRGLEELLAIPMAGHKGYALALSIQVLCRVLTGQLFEGENPPQLENKRYPTQAHIVQAIDIEKFMDVEEFKAHVSTIIDRIKKSRRKEGTAEIYIPGEKSSKHRAESFEKGVVIMKPVLEYLQRSLMEIGIDLDLLEPR